MPWKESRSLLELMSSLKVCSAAICQVHFLQLPNTGTAGDFFYIVERGVFSVIINGATVGELSDGKYFGELALLYDTNRQATIRCGDATAIAYTLDRNTFRYIVAHSADDRRGEIQRALSKVPLLQGLTKQQIMKISDSVEIVKFNIGRRT
jgi:CRP-like cAMP-binding protein